MNRKITLALAVILMSLWVQPPLMAQAFSWLSQPDLQAGQVLNGSTGAAKISANGRYVAFVSGASNIVAGDNNQRTDLFIQDMVTNTVQRYELNAGFPDLRGFSTPTSDGRYIVVNTQRDVFTDMNYVILIDTVTGTNVIQNINLDGDRFDLIFSDIFLADDGSQMIFHTRENLDPLHTDTSEQIYAKDLNTNQYSLLSLAPGGGLSEGVFDLLDVSVNQQFIALESGDGNLLPGIVLDDRDNLVVLDLSDNSYTLASVLPDGTASFSGFFGARSVSISNSGQMAYISDKDDLIADDNNDDFDVFFFDGTNNTRVSLDNNGQELTLSAGLFDVAVISPNDAFISYSLSSELVVPNDNNQTFDAFIYDISTGATTRASSLVSGQAAGDATFPTAVSTNGQNLLLRSYAKDYGLGTVINRQQQTFVYSVNQQAVTQMLPSASISVNTAHSEISQSHISADQQFAFYLSQSPYLSADTVSDYSQFETRASDLFEHDRSDDSHKIIARKVTSDIGNGGTFDVSSSGQYVVFSSNYFQPDANFMLSSEEVFLYDRLNNSYLQIGPGNDPKVNDAGMVVFRSFVGLVAADSNGTGDIYLFDSADNSLNLVSKNLSGVSSVFGGNNPFISDSATDVWVGFTAFGSDFINNDTNGRRDVFMYNWPAGNTIRVSQLTDGTGGDDSSGSSSFATEISADGGFVLFSSFATNLTNHNYIDASSRQLFLYERATQAISLVSFSDGGLPFNDEAGQRINGFDISESGRYVSFAAFGEFNIFNDFDEASDVYLYDHQTQQIDLISQNSNAFTPNGDSENPRVVEDLSVSPPLLGFIFDGSGDLTDIDNHSGHTESFLYQQGGPDVELTIEVIGMGNITGSFGINCMTTCDSSYPLGTELSLLAIPDAGFIFDRWSSSRNDCNDTQNCAVTMDRMKTIQAIFVDENDVIFSNGFE